MTVGTDQSAKIRFPARTLLGLATVIAAVVTLALPTGEAALRSSFESALKSSPFEQPRLASAPPVAGSEDYWLSALSNDAVRSDANAPLVKTLAIGDEIDLTVGGQRRTYEVQTVSEFAPKLTTIDTAGGQGRVVLVTARDKKMPAERAIRFLLEVGNGPAPLVANAPGRAL